MGGRERDFLEGAYLEGCVAGMEGKVRDGRDGERLQGRDLIPVRGVGEGERWFNDDHDGCMAERAFFESSRTESLTAGYSPSIFIMSSI